MPWTTFRRRAPTWAGVTASRNLRLIPFPSSFIGYLLFNQRDPRDQESAPPHLSDRDVRRAIGLALDRRAMVRATFGPRRRYPSARPRQCSGSAAARRRPRAPTSRRPAGCSPRAAGRITMATARSTGTAHRSPSDAAAHHQRHPAADRPAGAGAAAPDRHPHRAGGGRVPALQRAPDRGRFDLDFAATSQDPSPTGLAQSWSCAGGTMSRGSAIRWWTR